MKANLNCKVKDSVSTDLFGRKKYLAELHYELTGEKIRPNQIRIVKLNNVLTKSIYNDVAYLVDGKVLYLVEFQSKWNPNMAYRMLVYCLQTWEMLLSREGLNMNSDQTIRLCSAKMYTVYLKKDHLKVSHLDLNLTDPKISSDVKARTKIIRPHNCTGILKEYGEFCRRWDNGLKEADWTHLSESGQLNEALKIIDGCIQDNILSDYLTGRRFEVRRIMVDYFNAQAVQRQYVADEKRRSWRKGRDTGHKEGHKEGREEGRKEGREEGRKESDKRTIVKLSKKMDGTSIAEILEMDPDYVAAVLKEGRSAS